MPLEKRTRTPSSAHQRTHRSKRPQNKFIPNLKQINEAAKELPDPESWPEKKYQSLVTDDTKEHTIEFRLQSINRGEAITYRWIYDGKILIRNRDI